jgi:hypothetical protein
MGNMHLPLEDYSNGFAIPVYGSNESIDFGVIDPGVKRSRNCPMYINLNWRDFTIQYLFRPAYMLFTEPIVFLVSLYMSFVYGLMYAVLAAFPVIFLTQGTWCSEPDCMAVGDS